VRVTSIAPRADGAGLDVGVDGPGASDNATAINAVPALHGSVHVDTYPAHPAVMTSRESDVAPYWGGGEMASNTNLCSTGFAVADPTGTRFILSASHCSPSQSDNWLTGDGGATTGGLLIGSVVKWNPVHDSMLIGPTSSDPRIYTDGSLAEERPQSSLPVHGATATQEGDGLCTSGAFSGEQCNINAIRTGITVQIVDDTGATFCFCQNMVQADQLGHADATGNGDSGGPVISFGTDGSAIARGTITGQDNNAPAACTGVPEGVGRTCSYRVFYPDITFEQQDMGVQVLT
jgi:hypothetical protein